MCISKEALKALSEERRNSKAVIRAIEMKQGTCKGTCEKCKSKQMA